ncbi:MAG: single-strand selective monofunctional uracil DNA glycosylase [Chlamydiales bacterium]|jgi:single-strand selective monofunctional uracil DNA glycosylase
MQLTSITRELQRSVDKMTFSPPVEFVYNPLDYARRGADAYLERFGSLGAETLLVGMNPGPYGMSQTGVPFGEIELVRDWMGIEERIDRPQREHPKRPIEGFACTRSEVSGRRLWGWARNRFKTPERFFERFFVWNYCPLVFMEESGRNRTPDKLPKEERDELFALCDAGLVRMVEALKPKRVIGIGKFAEKRAMLALAERDLIFGTLLHPSPASPMANRGWEPQAEKQLEAMGIKLG